MVICLFYDEFIDVVLVMAEAAARESKSGNSLLEKKVFKTKRFSCNDTKEENTNL